MPPSNDEQRIAFIEQLLNTNKNALVIDHVIELQEMRVRLEERMNKGEKWLDEYQGVIGDKYKWMDGDVLSATDKKFKDAYELLERLSHVVYPGCMELLKVLTSMNLPVGNKS